MRLVDADALLKCIPYEDVNSRFAVQNAPTIEERNKGEWIKNSPVTMRCNQCGFVIKDWDWHRFKYCPNCGATMKDGEKR